MTRKQFHLVALSEFLKLKFKGPKDAAWLYGCWCAYKSGFKEYQESAADFERLLIEAFENKEPAAHYRLAEVCGAKRKPRSQTNLRIELLRALIAVSRSEDPTWSHVKALVELERTERTWSTERKKFPFRDLPD